MLVVLPIKLRKWSKKSKNTVTDYMFWSKQRNEANGDENNANTNECCNNLKPVKKG